MQLIINSNGFFYTVDCPFTSRNPNDLEHFRKFQVITFGCWIEVTSAEYDFERENKNQLELEL